MSVSSSSRRSFLKTAALGSAALALSPVPRVHAGENHTIKVALVGCGGRGGGAAVNALSTEGPVKLWAVADVFENRLEGCLRSLEDAFPEKVDVPKERQFLGFDAFKKAIDSLDPGDVVLLATIPAFRPQHVEYAVQKGINVFMEKSFGVDVPGVKRIMESSKLADQKNVKIACGLMWRHCKARAEAIDRIHQGEIGDLVHLRTYRMHGPVWMSERTRREKELGYQIRNYSNFTWTNGSFLLDWQVHNIDICCWAKNAWPVKVLGMGGRAGRRVDGQEFDHYNVEYTFADGSNLYVVGRHCPNCFDMYSDFVHGTKGSGVLMTNLSASASKLYKNQLMIPENVIWAFPGNEPNPYQVEMDRLFAAIRQDVAYNEGHRAAQAALAGIFGRMSVFSGKEIHWEEAIQSTREEFPGLDQITWETQPPVLPNEQGEYPIAIPGETAPW
ncbi:MAG: Gfo/Idh/MocA family protein [Thermoguttaceae bacterium]